MTENAAASPAPASAAVPRPYQPVGMGEVLSQVRKPEDLVRPAAVEFRNVSKTYNAGLPNEYTAIRNVSFVVEDLVAKGEFVCTLGPSGCGKSTILRLIAGLAPQHPATAGDVIVLGRPIDGPGPDRGMVFQDYTSFDHRTVLDNVTFGLECQGMPRRQRYDLGRHWIERVGLSVDKDQYKYPHELSGGMRQRVAIARTLILRPRIILMDEPFGALDPMTRMNMQDLLLTLWREVEATVFFITHSIEEAVFLGDRVYIMSNSPGTILKEMQIRPSDKPAKEMQKEAGFQETVFYIRDVISHLEESRRAGT
ncbi:MAG: ABC transporter ATP-binding protein [Planctomycetia bacterium]|nr:ABC transporter ATP-binding protein [Planctomycetia bacterium]